MTNGFVDIHAHILPGVDDGARDIEESLMMAQMAVDSGVGTIVATPHSHTERALPPRYAEEIEARVRALQYRLRCEEIPLRLRPGMEIFATEEVPRLLSDGQLLTLNGSRYALVEFDFEEDPDFFFHILHGLQRRRFVPVIAHPERYACVAEEPELLRAWREEGCLFQVNKGSLLGRFGERIAAVAKWLLKEDMIMAVASDAHSAEVRTTDMREIAEFLDWRAERLLRDAPARLLEDDETLAIDWKEMEL